VGVAGQILQDSIGTAEVWLAVDDPLLFSQTALKLLHFIGVPMAKVSALPGGLESAQKESPEAPAQDPHRKEESVAGRYPLLAIGW
jgi:hypothetical protein